MEIQEYIRENGSNPYKESFDSLDPQAAKKVARATYRMQLGNTSEIKGLRGGIAEYRTFNPAYRIYLTQESNKRIVLFWVSHKDNQKADIEKALELYQEYKKRKKKNQE